MLLLKLRLAVSTIADNKTWNANSDSDVARHEPYGSVMYDLSHRLYQKV